MATQPEPQSTTMTYAADEYPPRAAQPPSRKTIPMGERGLILGTFDEMWRFSCAIIKGGFGSRDDTAESMLIKLQMASELGLTYTQAITGIYTVDGKPALYGDVLLGLCRVSPQWDEDKFSEELIGKPFDDDYTAVVTVGRKDRKAPIRHEFSVADAKRAGLWGRQSASGKPMPWTSNPKRMLMMRARGFALRDGFAEVLKGMLSVEEMRDMRHEMQVSEVLEQVEVGPRKSASDRLVEQLASEKPAPVPAARRGVRLAADGPAAAPPPAPADLSSRGPGTGADAPERESAPAPTPTPIADISELKLEVWSLAGRYCDEADLKSGLAEPRSETTRRQWFREWGLRSFVLPVDRWSGLEWRQAKSKLELMLAPDPQPEPSPAAPESVAPTNGQPQPAPPPSTSEPDLPQTAARKPALQAHVVARDRFIAIWDVWMDQKDKAEQKPRKTHVATRQKLGEDFANENAGAYLAFLQPEQIDELTRKVQGMIATGF